MGETPCLDVTRSIKGRRWTLRHDPESLDTYQAQTGLTHLEAALLTGREVKADYVERFLNPTLKNSLPDPSSFTDMDKAARLILDHMADRKKMTLFSDYDVDGGTSAAQLIRWARGLGYEFGLYVPDRIREGYGPNEAAFDRLKAEGVDLVITLDCGAAAQGALEHAHKIGLPVIVVDHHQMNSGLPPALAVVNPNRQDDQSGQGHLAAAGVTFMLLVAMQREARKRGLSNPVDLKSLVGLAALGTICDVVSLEGVNRAIVRQGLKVLSANRNIGVKALADVANATPPYTTYHAGFILGPRINAGGRIGNAEMGAELLSTEDAQRAYGHAAELDRVNAQRRQMQDRILEEAKQAAQSQTDAPVIVVAMEDWHAGIIGIVAGRLKDRLRKPVIVIGIDHDAPEPIAKGSGRSIKGVDLGKAISDAVKEGLLHSGGGHAMAGGLSVSPDKIGAFREFICENLQTDVEQALANESTKIDAILDFSAINDVLLETIDRVGPYGVGNPQPVFAFSDVSFSYAKPLKGGHIRFTLVNQSGASLSGICFRASESPLGEVILSAGEQRFHAAGQVKANHWKGRTSIDFQLLDLARISG